MKTIILATALVAVACLPATAQDDAEATQARYLANLKLQFPQLAQMNVQMGELKPTAIDGLSEGSFTVSAPQGSQTQNFLVTSDQKLYLVSQAVDVSRGDEEIQAELSQRADAEAKKAAEMRTELAGSVEGLPFRGNASAPVTIVEFSDFQCPYCARGSATVDQILEKYGEDVKVVFKHFPLGFHPWARPAAIAAHCAGQQKGEAFWTLHDKLFANQKALNEGNVIAESKKYLEGTGVDLASWSTCAEDTSSEAYKAAEATVTADMALGQKLGVSGTPGFFVNGRFLNGAQPLTAFEPLIAQAKNDS